MAEKELSILVRAKGIAKAVSDIGKVNTSIGKLSNTAKQGALNLAANLAKIGLIAGGAIGAGVIAGIKSLEDLERVTNATAGVIQSTGGIAGVTAGQVRDLANAMEDVTTVDDKVIQGGENLLLTFTGIGKDIFPQATKAMTDMAIAMAQGDVSQVDLKATAIQLGKALQDPIRGATTLRRVGVQLSDQQEKQIKTLVKSGDTLGAQKIILAELEKEFGKAGKAAGTGFGADIRRVKDAVEDAEQALAVGFLPVIRKVADWLRNKLADKGTLAAIKDFGTKLAGGFDKMLAAVSRIPWSTIGDGLKTAGQWAGKLFDAFLNLPPEFQSTIIALAGLNKLSGGAIGSIVGQLGSGLIKGVLGMNAGVVNINAGVVNGGGGGSPGGAAGPGIVGSLGRMALGVLPVALVAASIGAVAVAIGEQINEATRRDPQLQASLAARKATTGATSIQGGRGGALAPGGVHDPNRVVPVKVTNDPKTGALSPEERQALNDQTRAITKVYDATEKNRLTLAAKLGETAHYSAQATAAAIRDIRIPAPVVNVNAYTSVSVRDVAYKTKVSLKYGKVIS